MRPPYSQRFVPMSDHRSLDIDANQRRIGPIWLSPGVLPRHALVLFLSGALAIGFVNLVGLIQPLLLQEQLGMTGGEGSFTATLYIIVVGSGLTQLPRLFTAQGYTPVEASTYTLWIGSGLALIAALLSYGGLKKGRATDHEDQLPFLENARIGLREIRGNPRLILGCAATMLSRGDLTVLAAFFSLWVQKVGADSGIASVDASATAGRLFGLTQVAMLCSMPIIASVADRFDRVTTLCLSMTIASIGYFALGFSPNPFESPLIYLVVALAGMGEAVVIVSVPTLIGQEAPARFRGSIIGVAATFGALGIILTNQAAGYLFDNWSYQGPFIFMGILNALMLIWAVSVRLLAPPPAQ